MSNLNKKFSYTIVSEDDEDIFYVISSLFLANNVEVINSITFSDKWKLYNTVGITEKQIIAKFEEIGAVVLSIDSEQFALSLSEDRKTFIADNIDDFIDALLDFNNSNGISSFPFLVGNQYTSLESKILDFLETLDGVNWISTKGFENEEQVVFTTTV